ncbi:6522_t:CDS:2, partial [Scutellospora calospora]
LLDSRHHYDEICTLKGYSVRELEDILKNEPESKKVETMQKKDINRKDNNVISVNDEESLK